MKAVPLFLFLSLTLSLVFFVNDTKSQTLAEMDEIKAEYALPSLSVAIGMGNEIIFAEAIGYADIASQKKADTKTQYSVGSVAKPMTGLAIAKLVDADKIRLDAFVSEYINEPGYTNSFTVKELASHLAGVPHDTPERDNAEFVEIKDHKSPFDAFPVFSSHPLLFEPGSDFQYSSNGYILLSAVIEQAAQMNYVDFLSESLWKEFQMRSTELDVSTAEKPKEEQTWTALHHGGVTDDASTEYLLVIPQCKTSIAFATNYIPPKFWEIRGEMARMLIDKIDSTQCL